MEGSSQAYVYLTPDDFGAGTKDHDFFGAGAKAPPSAFVPINRDYGRRSWRDRREKISV